MQPYVKSGPVLFFLHPREETVLKWVTVLSLLLPPNYELDYKRLYMPWSNVSILFLKSINQKISSWNWVCKFITLLLAMNRLLTDILCWRKSEKRKTLPINTLIITLSLKMSRLVWPHPIRCSASSSSDSARLHIRQHRPPAKWATIINMVW